MPRQTRAFGRKIFDRFRDQSTIRKDWAVLVYPKGLEWGDEGIYYFHETEADAREAATLAYRAEYECEANSLIIIMTDRFE